MKFKLLAESKNNFCDLISTVLNNRGIENIKEFLNPAKANCLGYELLDNIQEAVRCMVTHIENNSNIHIVVDSDSDGYCSAAMLYQYLKKYAPALNITYSLHTGKQHGLSEDIEIPTNTNLIVIPDASSNDFEQHEFYRNQGMDIIVLDHHECEVYSKHAIVVNNQMSKKYTNKAFCGAGVTYKFLKALDDELWNNDADNYLDLVAIANIGDVMDSRSLETRHYMNEGLKRIKSNAIKAFCNKVSDRMGEISLIGVAFYIIPLINAMIRVGTQEQKDLMFKAFCNEYDEFDYTKRDKSVIKENIYDRVARECVNAKSRQDRQKTNMTESVASRIDSTGLNENQLILCNVDDLITRELTGLVAMGVANKYKRPALLYRTRVKENDEEKICTYEGSLRNFDGYELEDLRTFLIGTRLFDYVDGHANAAGFGFKPENEEIIIETCNRELSKYSIDYTYHVDFIVPFESLDDSVFYDMDKIKGIWGQRVDEPMFAILDVDILLNKVSIKESKTGSTVRFEVDGITFIRFRVSEDDELLRICQDWEFEENNAKLNIVGRVGINSFGGIKSRQVIVSDWEIIK